VRWLIVIALAACEGKQAVTPTMAPTMDSIDRRCKVDADCMLVVDACCLGCGDDLGEPVNGSAWMKTLDARRAHCNGMCPDYKCAKPPDCREVGVAVCQSGTCGRVMKKTAACDDLACETRDDCVLYSRMSDCCHHCGGKALSRAGAARADAEIEKTCATKLVKCPPIDCPALPIDCVNKQCSVTR
jgi:hypothetical protein